MVDDNPEILRDFKSILCPPDSDTRAMRDMEQALFGEAGTVPNLPTFPLVTALQGDEALRLLQEATGTPEPFAVAFVDVRMPPGLDGVEAATKMLALDKAVQIVLCTAFADYRWEQIATLFGDTDRLLILKKPFDPLEVRQLTRALVAKWHLAQERARYVTNLEAAVRERTLALSEANTQLRSEMTERTLAQDNLYRAQRVQALGRLTAGVAHEINNPLSYIRTNLDFVTSELRHNTSLLPFAQLSELTQALSDAQEGVNKIERIVRDVKLYVRGDNTAALPMQVGPAMEEALALLGRSLGLRATIERNFCEVPDVLAVYHRIEQVFVNILSNAMLAFRIDDPGKNRVLVEIAPQGRDEVMVRVRDNGCGIPEADLTRVFDPFFTTRPVGEGTGLGLAVSQGIITNVGGRIDVQSVEGQGTTVTVVLPRARPGACLASVATGQPAVLQTKLSVLALDDDESLLRALERLLKDYQVTTCRTVAGALALARERFFDIILCDVILPGRDGLSLVAELATSQPAQAERVILMTGGTLSIQEMHAIRSAGCPCIDKPFTAAQLAAVIQTRLQLPPSRPAHA